MMLHMSSLPVLTIRPGSLDAWAIAMRPRTLWIATVPVLVGTALAWLDSGKIDWIVALLALTGSLLMQIITNLQNDVGYSARGIESAARVGMPRATSSGLLTPQQVRVAIAVAIIAALIVGWPLVQRGGWPVVAMGITSIIAALSYMGGPRPIAFTPYGELTVFLFFGIVAVTGSGYVQIGVVTPATWIAASGVGLIAAAVLAINNHRDAAHDARTGRRTFAVQFGAHRSSQMYSTLVLGAFVLVPAAAWSAHRPALLLPLLMLPTGWRLASEVRMAAPGPALGELLLRTVKLEMLYGALLSVGAVVAGL